MSADPAEPAEPAQPLPPLPTGADLPPLEELLEHATVVAQPMRTRFRGTTVREALLLRGPHGWAEFSPFPEYGAQESSRWLAAAIEAGWQGWPDPVRTHVPVNATVPALPAEKIAPLLERFGPVPAVKVKVAEQPAPGTAPDPRVHGVEADLARVAEVHRLLPDAAVRIDANAGWDHATALEALRRLAVVVPLEYAEQPVPGIQGLARLREALAAERIPTPIAADESVRKETDPLAVAQAGAADLIVVKVQPLGGVRRALAIVQATGLDAVVSSALDTSVGIAGGVALAAALPRLPHACGLGTVALFTQDVVDPPWIPDDGQLAVTSRPVPDGERTARLRAPAEAQARWRERLSQAYQVLAVGE
ncbi:o-succinylbenzoate synthase [Micrococcus terreus]|uniref:o-succinylbenzoate synthase n=1 Tax=Micrococcus terreus TaxID=574650 RepID=UPI0021A5EF33|nr:o-succinylbenzoate synthase [Micrococcus terreus]MCT2087782.1 o-succinylbenzoate synthase [Micrococcus terreus]MDK7700378.1 o-succinylbenzoate synthase [Micrococcus terreus]WOO96482.1 o-succinylbenzoate synthase [Micrococcus terreus]